jgi:hypothetical protein
MFKIQPKSPTYKSFVNFKEVSESGSFVRHSIEMEFKRMSRRSFDEAINAIVIPKDEDGTLAKLPIDEALAINADQLLELICDWKILDTDNKPFPFTRDNLIMMLDSYPNLLSAIMETAVTGFNGGAERKN